MAGMRRKPFQNPDRLAGPVKGRGFTLVELLVAIAIMAVVMAIAVPSFVSIRRDLERSKARSDVYGALAAARGRAITSRNMVALHIFRDTLAYQTDPRRWGQTYNGAWTGTPHFATNRMMMRLETAKRAAGNAVEFSWPADHDPIILPENLGICRPGPGVDFYADIRNEFVPAAALTMNLWYPEDFYIVFGDDGKLVDVLVDYASYFDSSNPGTDLNPAPATTLVNAGGTPVPGNLTWSSSALCIYDMATYKAQPNIAAAYAYATRAENTWMINAYTGMPLSQEANQ
jgi:prepilin-type N-terminal cleavage/methylation domain-containing protein